MLNYLLLAFIVAAYLFATVAIWFSPGPIEGGICASSAIILSAIGVYVFTTLPKGTRHE